MVVAAESDELARRRGGGAEVCRKLARIAAAGASVGRCCGRRRRRRAVELDGCDATTPARPLELELGLAAWVEKEAATARLQQDVANIAATAGAEDGANAMTVEDIAAPACTLDA